MMESSLVMNYRCDNQEYIDFVKRSIDWRIRYEK